MECHIALVLLLSLTVECSSQNRFFISAPNVFHIGVSEKVFIQMETPNVPVTLYLEHETGGNVVSEKNISQYNPSEKIRTVELKIDSEMWSKLSPSPSYLLLVAESPAFTKRQITRVLISKHRGYIFIQTDQPMYNPTQRVNYRIFALNHLMRPQEEMMQISVFNAAGNRVKKTLNHPAGGIFRSSFFIPSISKMGTWKITAHYVGDEANAVSREFKVQKFVLPTFDVDIAMEENYVYLNAEQIKFTISAMYTYGEKVQGAYHCQFGVLKKGTRHDEKQTHDFIKGLELTGSVQNGSASVHLQTSELNSKLQNHLNQTLSDLLKSGKQIYLRVFVTNIQSGEVQEAEVHLPIISQKYSIDFSRTRSHFLPGYPLDVVVFVRLPDGTPAAGLPVEINLHPSSEERWQTTTDQEGAAFHTFNLQDVPEITVVVSSDELEKRKTIRRAASPSNSYLYMTFTPMMYSVGDSLAITFNTINAPQNGSIYYMVLSRGMLIESRSVALGVSVKGKLQITAKMVPSFHLIGYYHNRHGDIIADSVWVDVRDECEIKVKVEKKGPFMPGKHSVLEFDLQDQRAKVALLAVDKAFYALNADNKLTPKEMFSAMASYDLGCTHSDGADSASVLLNAGLSFMSNSMTKHPKEVGCESLAARQKRSVDLKQELETLKSDFLDTDLKECCSQGFVQIPMTRTCQERANRVFLVKKNQTCADAFLKCCIKAESLRQRKMQEDNQKGFGRTITEAELEVAIESSFQNVRRFFPPSFEFTEFDVNRKRSYSLALPDSITTWEIQIVTLSMDTGFCVVKPTEVKAFKDTFVSLTLPYSVKKYEQLSISPVIYNYGDTNLQVAVHMEQTQGLCSPGSATSTSFVNITLKETSSQFVSFSAVPMVTGSIPIKIHLFDIEMGWGIDVIEKKLNVQPEGLVQTLEETKTVELVGKSTDTLTIDGFLPDDTVPDYSSNLFISLEGNGFGNSYAKKLLSAKTIANLIDLPDGCLEQTMTILAPTVLAVRYLDLSDQWFDLPAGSRDDAFDKIETGYMKILSYKQRRTGSYGVFSSVQSSNWVTALVVKMLSLVAQRQTVTFGQQGRAAKVVPEEEITDSVIYLLSIQNKDDSFSDQHPVLHRNVLESKDQKAAMTAFITLALHHSRAFVPLQVQNNVEASISRSARYLQSTLDQLQHPYAVAITAYCLAVCLPEGTNHSAMWTKLQALSTKGKDGCYLWTTDSSPQNQKVGTAITVETTAYALLAAVELGENEWADKTACWLTTQENYFGGYKSTQDTVMALEALSEYELKRPARPDVNIIAQFTVPGKGDIVTLTLENQKEKVETDLKKLVGNNITLHLTGKGKAKLKVLKSYHLLGPKDRCTQLSISVTVEGKVKYTAKVIENYDYYDYDNNEDKAAQEPQIAIDGSDTHIRNRRAADNDVNSKEVVTYTVCVRVNSNLTGMAIADITLLSGFVAVTDDLEKLKLPPEQYISHYEVSYGRVLIYFNELFQREECISFTAEQKVPVGLLQPAPAVFYDYYEPSRRCTVFYSAPQRSKMVSTLCSEDVCQCAERPCHKLQETFKLNKKRRVSTDERELHACFSPTVDYAYIVEVLSVSVKSNFELFKSKVIEVIKSNGDLPVTENSVRAFAKRLQCKVKLDVGTQYLIMGKDGSTTDSDGQMQYLLVSNTWVEKRPSTQDCSKTAHRAACQRFDTFIAQYKLNGCTQ
ncbi:complement C4-B isoform X2 [Parambassis ranga]|uniref:Complement C4-B isoform X2 n=1 Tax=Parambassis ranga TaxID=210632 RepID=A0A6P7JUL7_9TELE|nr:complement C4-like isoform X2 [Parambassis ranga]